MNVVLAVPLLQTPEGALGPGFAVPPLGRPPAQTKEEFTPLLGDLIGKLEVNLRAGLPTESALNFLGRRTPTVRSTVKGENIGSSKSDDATSKPAFGRTRPESVITELPAPLTATTWETHPGRSVVPVVSMVPEATPEPNSKPHDTSTIHGKAAEHDAAGIIPTAQSPRAPVSVPGSLRSNPFSEIAFGLRLTPTSPQMNELPRTADAGLRPELPRDLRIETAARAGAEAGPEPGQVFTTGSNPEPRQTNVARTDPAVPGTDSSMVIRNYPDESGNPLQSRDSVTTLQEPKLKPTIGAPAGKPNQVDLRPEPLHGDAPPGGSWVAAPPEPIRTGTKVEPNSSGGMRSDGNVLQRQAAILFEPRTDSEKHPAAGSIPLSGSQGSISPKPADRHDTPLPTPATQSMLSAKPREKTDEESGVNRSSPRLARAEEGNKFADLARSRPESHAHAGALGTPGQVAGGQGPSLTRPDRPAADISPPPNTELQPDPNSVARPEPARQISLKLPGNGGARVDVDLIERAGKVQIAVRTSDRELAKSLRTDLPDLVGRLENKGFKTEAWVPGAGHLGAAEASARPTSSSSHGDPKNPGSGAGEEPGRQHHNGSNQRQQARWKAQFQATLSSDELENTRTEKQ